MSKLSLGTVQFGLNYGVSNKNGKVKYEEVKKIPQWIIYKHREKRVSQ